jgi:hypothetical protein
MLQESYSRVNLRELAKYKHVCCWTSGSGHQYVQLFRGE